MVFLFFLFSIPVYQSEMEQILLISGNSDDGKTIMLNSIYRFLNTPFWKALIGYTNISDMTNLTFIHMIIFADEWNAILSIYSNIYWHECMQFFLDWKTRPLKLHSLMNSSSFFFCFFCRHFGFLYDV